MPSDNDRAMTIEATSAAALPRTEETAVVALADLLLDRGLVDGKTLERARRVSADTGQRLDSVLIQLGLIGERGLAEAYAALLGLQIAGPDRYHFEPVLADRLKPKFLRKARALPPFIVETPQPPRSPRDSRSTR